MTPRALEKILEREILAERHEMDLVVAADDASLIVDDEQAVIDALGDELIFGVASSTIRPEPTTRDVPSGSTAPMASSASGESASGNGTAVSGQMTMSMPARLARLGEVEIVGEDLGAVLRAPFVGLVDIGLDDAQADAGARHCGRVRAALAPHIAEPEQAAMRTRGERRAASAAAEPRVAPARKSRKGSRTAARRAGSRHRHRTGTRAASSGSVASRP